MINDKENQKLIEIRHSLAHVMAQAVIKLFPDTKLAIGPAIDNGFYYDFDTSHHFTPEDLPLIEKEMRRIIKEDQIFEHYEMDREKALNYFSEKGEKYKVELIKDLQEVKVSIYKNGPFEDLCKGPHVKRTSDLPLKSFKLSSIAGAYWRGDERNPMLQRIYGLAFETEEELNKYLKMMEEASKRDHRKLGKEMEIFFFDEDVGQGLPMWLPNGAIMIEELEKLAKETEEKAGYKRVKTPHICKEKIYLTSGHLPYYAESMFPPMEIEGTKYYLKPMNCPHHHKIYASKIRSYRDLPLRLAEYGTCYRYEQSGELFGLMRVRSLQMNDAHIYCTPEQFAEEFLAVSNMYINYFKIFGIEKYLMRFSTHSKEGLGKKYVNEPELWIKTEELVRKTLTDAKIEFKEISNEAAFYGPKIDVEIWSVIGREFTLATNQVDFAIPKRFNLVYKDKDGIEKTPLCIHRAPLGTHERFIGFLIEHFGGHFPLWLSPVQVKILTITDNEQSYAMELYSKLKELNVRVEIDISANTISSKIKEASLQRPGYTIIIGKKEAEKKTLSLRLPGNKNIYDIDINQFIENLIKEIKNRQLNRTYK